MMDYGRKFVTMLYLMSFTKNKDPSIRVKKDPCVKHFFFSFTTTCLISAEWMSGCDLFNMSCLSSITLMYGLDILSSNPFNFKDKIQKTKQKKIFCSPSKVLKTTSWSINICLKYFMTSTKTLRSPLLRA